jgi:hypothetical protein
MRLGPKILLAVGVLATVVAVGFWLARHFVEPSVPMTDAAPEVDIAAKPPRSSSTPGDTPASPPAGSRKSYRPAELATGPDPIQSAVGTPPLLAEWENRIDDILRLESEPSTAGKRLMELLPQLPADGRVEALEHAANLIGDEDYAPLGRLLSDPKTSEEELEILMRDVLNRSNELKLPLLLQVARTSGHLKATESREILEVFLGEDYGDDWTTWQAKVTEFIKENPEPSAADHP